MVKIQIARIRRREENFVRKSDRLLSNGIGESK